MTPLRNVWSIGAAVAVAGALVSASWGFGRQLEHAAARTSRQRPTNDHWFEPVTPASPELVRDGRKLFLDSCAHCHGADAAGDEGPDLHDLQVSDRYIAHMINFGEPHEMPSFAKKLGAKDIGALAAYLRSLKSGA